MPRSTHRQRQDRIAADYISKVGGVEAAKRNRTQVARNKLRSINADRQKLVRRVTRRS